MEGIIGRLRPVYENVGSMLLSAALVYAFGFVEGMDVHVLFVLAVSALTMAAAVLLGRRRNTVFVFVVPVLAVAFVLLLFRLLDFDGIAFIKGMAGWAVRFFSGRTENNRPYAYVLIGLVAVLAGILIKRADAFFPARAALSALLLAGGVLLSVSRIETPKFSICIGLFYCLGTLIEAVSRVFGRRISLTDAKSSAVYLMPVCLLAGILAAILPAKDEPIRWQFVRDAASAVSEQVQLAFTEVRLWLSDADGGFAVRVGGYSEAPGKLGGALWGNNGVMFRVTTADKTVGSLYMTGSVRGGYTGDRWAYAEPYEDGDFDAYMLDFVELLSALQRAGIPPEELGSLLDKKAVAVDYAGVKTKTLFYPLKTYEVTTDHTSRGADLSGENMTFGRVKGRSTDYKLEFVDVNYRSAVFQDILRGTDGFSYRGRASAGAGLAPYLSPYLGSTAAERIGEADLNAVFARRAEEIRADYLAVPDSLPQRVRDLTADITRGYDTDYDKLKALEAFLNTYAYTTTPEPVPAGRDFVDNFLFEGKAGYCTYFASAMTVMGRCAGIPTRYVEGAVMDYAHKSADATYDVRNSQSHAWAEAYLEGVGWIPFEATSGFSGGRYAAWPTPAPEGAYQPGMPEDEPEEEPYPMPNLSGYGDPQAPVSPEKADYTGVIAVLVTVLLAVLFVASLIFLYYMLAKLRYERRYKKAAGPGKFHLLFNETMVYLKGLHYELAEQDTIRTFASRIGKRYVFDGRSFPAQADVFMRVRYAHKDVSADELADMAVFRDGLERTLSQQLGKVRLFLLRFAYYSRLE